MNTIIPKLFVESRKAAKVLHYATTTVLWAYNVRDDLIRLARNKALFRLRMSAPRRSRAR